MNRPRSTIYNNQRAALAFNAGKVAFGMVVLTPGEFLAEW